MATLIKSDGTEIEVHPTGKRWTLKELQTLIGGSIQRVPESDWGMRTPRILVDEEGKLKCLPHNVKATKIIQDAVAIKLGVPVDKLYEEVGRRLRYVPEISGPAVVLEKGEKLR